MAYKTIEEISLIIKQLSLLHRRNVVVIVNSLNMRIEIQGELKIINEENYRLLNEPGKNVALVEFMLSNVFNVIDNQIFLQQYP